MDRRSFIQLAVTQLAAGAPVFAQAGKPGAPGGRAARPAPPRGPAAEARGHAVDPVGRPAPQFSDRGLGHQGHLAGHRPARDVEASARRRLLVDRSSRTASSTRCTASRSRNSPSPPTPRPAQTLWEQASAMGFNSDAPEMGNGPYSTPLIVGDRLFTTGVAGRLQCLDKKSGKVLWTQQLWEDHGGSRLMYGYASSPIAFRDTVIVPVGGRGKAVMAFRQADGKVAWSRERLRQRLFVADPDRPRRPRAARRSCSTAR